MDDSPQNMLAVLADENTRKVIRDLGLEADMPEVQAEIISMLGENVLNRVVFEIVKVLPKEKIPEFETYLDSGNIQGFKEFLAPFIPDLEAFIQEAAQTEYRLVLSLARGEQ